MVEHLVFSLARSSDILRRLTRSCSAMFEAASARLFLFLLTVGVGASIDECRAASLMLSLSVGDPKGEPGFIGDPDHDLIISRS